MVDDDQAQVAGADRDLPRVQPVRRDTAFRREMALRGLAVAISSDANSRRWRSCSAACRPDCKASSDFSVDGRAAITYSRRPLQPAEQPVKAREAGHPAGDLPVVLRRELEPVEFAHDRLLQGALAGREAHGSQHEHEPLGLLDELLPIVAARLDLPLDLVGRPPQPPG